MTVNNDCICQSILYQTELIPSFISLNKRLSYHRGRTRCSNSLEIL